MPRPSSLPSRSGLRAAGSLALIALLTVPVGCGKDAAAVCMARLGITVQSGDFYVGDDVTASAAWSPVDDQCPSDFTWSVSRNLQIVGSGTGAQITFRGLDHGFATVSVNAGNYGSAESVEVLRTTGDLALHFDGLGDGAEPDIHLSGPNGFERDIDRDEMLRDVEPGQYSWTVNPVTGTTIGHEYAGSPDAGSIEVQRAMSASATIAYERLTAQIDFDAMNVPDPVPGAALLFAGETADEATDFALGGGGGGHTIFAKLVSATREYVIRSPRGSIAVVPDTYIWTAIAQKKGYAWQPTITTGTLAALLVATYPLSVPFIATRGILDLQLGGGLPVGLKAAALLTFGTSVFTPSIPTILSKQPGAYTLEVLAADFVNTALKRQETWQPIQAIHSLSLTAGQTLALIITLFLALWTATFLCNVSVISDPFGHALFILFLLTILLAARITRSNTGPPGPDGTASAVTETITLTGPSPWVTVTGPLQPDGSFVATGTGTVAGFPNVPVTFTGMLAADGSVSGTLQMGSDTPPTGLPNGSITYGIEGMRLDVQ